MFSDITRYKNFKMDDAWKDDLRQMSFLITSGKYVIPPPTAPGIPFVNDIKKQERLVNPSRGLEGIATDIVVKEFLKYANSNFNFLKLVYNTFKKAIKQYIKDKFVQPENGIFYIFKGGNVLRMIASGATTDLPKVAREELYNFYHPYFRKSDADFSIYIDPVVNTKNSRENNTSGFEEVFSDMRNMAYILQVYLRMVFKANMSAYFDFYKFNGDIKTKIMEGYFDQYKKNDSFTDETNELYYGGVPIRLTCAGVTVEDKELVDKYAYVKPEMMVAQKADIGSSITDNTKYDLAIMDDPGKANTMIIYPISSVDDPNKYNKSDIYTTANSALSFTTTVGPTHFDLVRTKVKSKLTILYPEDTPPRLYEKSLGGELIDCSIPHALSYGHTHFFEHRDKYMHKYEMINEETGDTFNFWSPSVFYIAHDLEYILYETVAAPWEDNKYSKRINRTMYLYAFDVLTKEELSDKETEDLLSELKILYMSILSISKQTYATEMEGVLNQFNVFMEKYKNYNLMLYTLLNNTIRLANDVRGNPAMYDDFIKFIKLVVDNIDVIIGAFTKQMEFKNQGSKMPRNQVYTGISAYQFSMQKGGIDEFYKQKYIKYKRKYFKLKYKK